jgi:putative oxidoreductase
LILRFVTGLSVATAAHVTSDPASTTHLLERCATDSVALLLWIGLWTPVAAVAEAAIQMANLLIGQRIDPSLVVAAGLGLALAMLGPGAWSLDARLFGRKRIV